MLQTKLAAIAQRRKDAPSLPRGIAPEVKSFQFRIDAQDHLCKAQRWDGHLSIEGKSRKASTLKATATSANTRPTISLGTGRPLAEYYPWHSISFQPFASNDTSSLSISPAGTFPTCTKTSTGYNLSLALNYGYSAGCPELVRFITEHVEMFHKPRYRDWESCLTCGTTNALDIVFRMLCDRGDWILAEEYCYPGTVEATKAQGINISGVKLDKHGLDPLDLKSKLENWDTACGSRPKVLYNIPCGQNPTGVTQTQQRRKQIYAIACDYDLLIVEDDPYHYLQLGDESHVPGNQIEHYIESLPQSYLSLDTCGRVLRLDSTSKILAPGIRAGWLTACSQLLSLFLFFVDANTVHASGVTQLMLKQLLEDSWGHKGFVEWLSNLSTEYRFRRDRFLLSCEKHLPKHLCNWQAPDMGMFIWITIGHAQHPSYHALAEKSGRVAAITELESSIYQKARVNGVLVSCGSWFVSQRENLCKLAFRLTFAAADLALFDEAVEAFGTAITNVFACKELSNRTLVVTECDVTTERNSSGI